MYISLYPEVPRALLLDGGKQFAPVCLVSRDGKGQISLLAFGSIQEFQPCRLHGSAADADGTIPRGRTVPAVPSRSPRQRGLTGVGKGTACRPPGKGTVTHREMVCDTPQCRTSRFSLSVTFGPKLEFCCIREFKKMLFDTFSAVE